MVNEWLTTKQAAELIGYNPEHIRRLVKAGKIQAQKFGRDWMIDRRGLLAYVRQIGKSGAKRGPKSAS